MRKRIIAAAATLLAATVVIASVLIDGHREKTEDPTLRVYSAPIVIQADHPWLAEHLALAVSDIHRALGKDCHPFVIDFDKKPDVIVTWTGVRPCNGEETAPDTAHMSLYRCGHIVVQEAVTPTEARLDFGHELGHVLSLAHDTIPGSIMNVPPDYNFLNNHRPAPTLTPKDVQWVRTRLRCGGGPQPKR